MGLKAQNCDAIVLPYFNGDKVKMADYPADKLDYRCQYSRNAFYVSDTVPDEAEVRSLTELQNKMTGERLTENFVVDLETLSYYAYTFLNLQQQYWRGNVVLCFPTPKSEHPYLVLRSLEEIGRLTDDYYATGK